MSNKLAVNNAQLTILTQKTPRKVIKQVRGRGGRMYDYVPHSWVTMQLNEAFNWQWSFEVINYQVIPEASPQEVIVQGALTVHYPDAPIKKMQFGGSSVEYINCPVCRNDYKKRTSCQTCAGSGKTAEMVSLADNLKAAASDCLKKCASLLGIAIDLYGGEDYTTDTPIDQETGEVLEQSPQTPSNGDVPNHPQKLFDYVNRKVEQPYDSVLHLFNAIKEEMLVDEYSWPVANDLAGWENARNMALSHARAKSGPVAA